MSESVKKRAYAKINLFLRVGGRKEGYHEIETLMQSIDLFDEIILAKTEDGSVTSDFPGDNSVKVLNLLSREFQLGGMRLSVRKNIPIGGGLGGSTADAAAAAIACAELWGLDKDRVKEIAAPLFSDIAFQMTGGSAIARGYGERLTKIPDLPSFPLLLAFPEGEVSTKEAYSLSDGTKKGKGNLSALTDALRRGERVQEYYLNDLLLPATMLNDKIAPLLERMRDERALLTGMTGSGSTLFSLYTEEEPARKMASTLAAPTLITRTISPFGRK